MDNKLCGKVVSISIDPKSNFSYISPNLVDKCGLRKEVHVESWLVQLATVMNKYIKNIAKNHK